MVNVERFHRNDYYDICPLQEFDIFSLLELERETFPIDAWSEEAMRREFAENPDGFMVVKEGQRIIGYVHTQVGYDRLIEQHREDTVDDGLIGSIAVTEDHQRKGIGEMLLRTAITRLQTSGVPRIVLDTRVSNHAMLALALKVGFKVVKIRQGYYENGEDGISMELRLRHEEQGYLC